MHAWVQEQVAAGHAPILLSGRAEKYREGTLDWLQRNAPTLANAPLIMRADRDQRHDDQVKAQALAQIERDHQVVGVIDDRPRVLALWRQCGFDPVVVLRPDWDTGNEPYTHVDRLAWANQQDLRHRLAPSLGRGDV